MALSGFLNVHKPPGVTSRDVVNQVQRLVRPAKVGHAGTLDPLATGVLVIAIGQATRLIEYVQQARKSYRGTFLLGRTSDTEDIEGDVRELDNPPVPGRSQIEAVAHSLIGEIQQRPPAYSAIKIAGQRSYDLARAGKAVELAARPVTVYDLRVTDYNYPQLVLDVTCGAGTYVRTLGRELAEQCGTGAVMSALVRTSVGAFRLERATPASDLSLEAIQSRLESPLAALAQLPSIRFSAADVAKIRCGQKLPSTFSEEVGECVALDEQGRLVALLEVDAAQLHPTRVFAEAD